jgi:hypothetical protein
MPARSRRTPQRIRAGRVEAQVKTGGRVLEPDRFRLDPRDSQPAANSGLREFGLRPADYDAVAARALTASSTQGNPAVLTAAELRAILAEAA